MCNVNIDKLSTYSDTELHWEIFFIYHHVDLIDIKINFLQIYIMGQNVRNIFKTTTGVLLTAVN